MIRSSAVREGRSRVRRGVPDPRQQQSTHSDSYAQLIGTTLAALLNTRQCCADITAIRQNIPGPGEQASQQETKLPGVPFAAAAAGRRCDSMLLNYPSE